MAQQEAGTRMRAGTPLLEFVEVSVEQQGVQGAAVAQSARTVLPGEPFDPPAASAVPGPREVPAAPQQPQGPTPQQLQQMQMQMQMQQQALQMQQLQQMQMPAGYGQPPAAPAYGAPAEAVPQWTYGGA